MIKNKINIFILYIHTIKYLNLKQIFFRLKYLFISPKKYIQVPSYGLNKKLNWLKYDYNSESRIGDAEFIFLNKKGNLTSACDWNKKNQEKLWLYNLHYFDYLNTKKKISSKRNIALMHKWIDENPIGNGNGWEQYTISLRIVNWIKNIMNNDINCNKIFDSLIIQSIFLYERPEFHIQANHLFSNSKALIFSGAFFQGIQADKILDRGLKIFNQELKKQILKDGGHFELSPMYHLIFLNDLLDLYNLCEAYPNRFEDSFVNVLLKNIEKMHNWLKKVMHPDEKLPLMNDSSNGISIDYKDLLSYMQDLGIPLKKDKSQKINHLDDSGFITVNDDKYFFIGNFSEVKASYQPGHFHAATLSFELSFFKKRFFVNSGTSIYAEGSLRSFQRSTLAHNTVCINNNSSSKIWGAFRLANRVKKVDISLTEKNLINRIISSHDGYKNFFNGQYHCRIFDFGKDKIKITDKIEGKYNQAVARYYLHPDTNIIEYCDNEAKIIIDNNPIKLKASSKIKILNTYYYPEFGLSIPNKCIELDIVNGFSFLEIKL